jgi:hypothetical protein
MSYSNRKRRAYRRVRGRRLAIAAATCALATGAIAGPASASTNATPPDASGNFTFSTLDNSHDLTFNQLLGINNGGLIAGYFGSGMAGHPNKGYRLSPPYNAGSYVNENVPHSVQTQVTGLDDNGVTVGFWADKSNNNFGFYHIIGSHRYHTVEFPTTNNASPQVDQLLGVNDHDVAVGFYTDSKGNSHGYTYNIAQHDFQRVHVSGASSVTATAINNLGDVAGFDTNAAGATEAFLLPAGGRVIHLSYPGAGATQAFGINDGAEVVGSYTMGTGSNATTHGFVWAPGLGFQNVDDPNGVGATTVNGVNDHGDLVGFYTDSSGNTDGMLATPMN